MVALPLDGPRASGSQHALQVGRNGAVVAADDIRRWLRPPCNPPRRLLQCDKGLRAEPRQGPTHRFGLTVVEQALGCHRWIDRDDPLFVDDDPSGEAGVGNIGLDRLRRSRTATRLVSVERQRAQIDEMSNGRMFSGIGDDRSTVVMTDEDDRLADPVENVSDAVRIVMQITQRPGIVSVPWPDFRR